MGAEKQTVGFSHLFHLSQLLQGFPLSVGILSSDPGTGPEGMAAAVSGGLGWVSGGVS